MLYNCLVNAYDRSKDNMTLTDVLQILYYENFHDWPRHMWLIDKNCIKDDMTPHNDDETYDDDYDVEKFHEEILKLGYQHFMIDYEHIYFNDRWQVIVRQAHHYVYVYCNLAADDSRLKEIQQILVPINIEDDEIEIGILTHRNGNYFINYESFAKMDIDVDKTYNDDIPEAAFDDFILNEDKGIALMYGEPGTGKTTFIKYLMQKHKNQKFIILDSYLLNDITSHSLLSVFIENKDAIYVLEDCEKLLRSREDMTNPIISTFLNMSDGILASVIKCKFICTFNTELQNIDDAIKRKGRMKLKYEFKKLDKNKCKKIDADINEDMTIADVIHRKKENDFSKKIKKKIGFN